MQQHTYCQIINRLFLSSSVLLFSFSSSSSNLPPLPLWKGNYVGGWKKTNHRGQGQCWSPPPKCQTSLLLASRAPPWASTGERERERERERAGASQRAQVLPSICVVLWITFDKTIVLAGDQCSWNWNQTEMHLFLPVPFCYRGGSSSHLVSAMDVKGETWYFPFYEVVHHLWLRRWTWNWKRTSRAGSNPARGVWGFWMPD